MSWYSEQCQKDPKRRRDQPSALHISLSHVMTDNNASRKRKHTSDDDKATHWLLNDTPAPPLSILNSFDSSTKLPAMSPSLQQQSSVNLFPTTRDSTLFTISRQRRQQRDRFNAQDREHLTNAFSVDVSIADRLIVPKVHPLLAAKLKQHQVYMIHKVE